MKDLNLVKAKEKKRNSFAKKKNYYPRHLVCTDIATFWYFVEEN